MIMSRAWWCVAVVAAVALSGCGLITAPLTRPRTQAAPTAAPTPAPTPDETDQPTIGPIDPSAGLPSTSTSVPTNAPATPTQAPTPASTQASDAPPRTYAEASARLAAATGRPQTVRAFRTPSGNIFCAVSGTEPGCELGEGRAAPPAGVCDTGGGGATDVGRVVFSDGTPTAICNSDTIVTPGAATLAYGSVASGPDSIRCLSAEIGVTCVDDSSQHGFFLARGMYLLF